MFSAVPESYDAALNRPPWDTGEMNLDKGCKLQWMLFPALVALAAPALAEWEKVSESESASYFIDRATLLSNGNLRRVWQLQNLKQRDRDGELSRRALVEYDCREVKNRTLSLSMHPEPMAGGKPLDAYSDPTSPRNIVPGSSGEVIYRLLCGR